MPRHLQWHLQWIRSDAEAATVAPAMAPAEDLCIGRVYGNGTCPAMTYPHSLTTRYPQQLATITPSLPTKTAP